MASAEKSLTARLEAHATLTDLVSTRIYPGKRPQDCAMPALRYLKISGDREKAMDSSLVFANPRFQIDCYAETYEVMVAVGKAVRGALEGWSGTVGGMAIEWIEFSNETDMEPATGVVPTIYRRSLDFVVHCEED